MAEGKKSFVLYVDSKETWEELTDEEAGKLIKHVFRYVNDENPVTKDPLIKIAFLPIKQALKRDLTKWESKQEQRREAGRRSAEARKRNATTVDERQHPSTVSGNGSVSGSDIKEVYKYTLEREILNSVYSLFNAKYLNTPEKKQKWLDEIRKLIQIDKENKQTIIDVITFARTDEFWKSNFLTINSIRKKTDGVSKFDKIKAKLNPNQALNLSLPAGVVQAKESEVIQMLGSETIAKARIAKGEVFVKINDKILLVRGDSEKYVNDGGKKIKL